MVKHTSGGMTPVRQSRPAANDFRTSTKPFAHLVCCVGDGVMDAAAGPGPCVDDRRFMQYVLQHYPSNRGLAPHPSLLVPQRCPNVILPPGKLSCPKTCHGAAWEIVRVLGGSHRRRMLELERSSLSILQTFDPPPKLEKHPRTTSNDKVEELTCRVTVFLGGVFFLVGRDVKT